MKFTGAAALFLATWAWVSEASATTPRTMLRVGDRVRVMTSESPSPITGRIVRADDSIVEIAEINNGASVTRHSIDWNALTRVERSSGYQSKTGRYMLGGFGIGVLAGTAGMFAAAESGGEGVAAGAPFVTGIVGSLIGAAIGASHTNEHWRDLPMHDESLPQSVAVPEEDADMLHVGDRVRVTTATLDRPVIGRIVRADDSHVTIMTDKTGWSLAGEQTIDLDSITRIDRNEGGKSKIGKYALITGSAGLLAGLYLGGMAQIEGENQEALYGAPIFCTSIGLLLGAAVGAAASGDRWIELSPDTQVGLQIGARSMPLALGIRASF